MTPSPLKYSVGIMLAPHGLQDLITTYHELNPDTIDELVEEPSPLEFMRYVARNRPFVIRRGAQDWPACKKWNAQYLRAAMGEQEVNVSCTPHGNADAPLHDPSSSDDPLFVKPHEYISPFSRAIADITAQSHAPQSASSSTHLTRYLQTQNNNLPNEYAALAPDIPASIPFAHIALSNPPDAVNFWLGNAHSVTALHKDNYENIYVQVVGTKSFVLLPPVDAPCVNERDLPAATYTPSPGAPSETPTALTPTLDSPPSTVPTATWDPDTPTEYTTRFSHLARPMRVRLAPGDILYLPALWYHKVSQECSGEGICVAVNYWYDMEFAGGFWSMCGFVRGFVKSLG
ncbi:Clavaminate synthase-like protein [Pseudovirgaria hyperparasitica]|uniref:Clavaminate synthase-like protein n=1 Tax=Pseudovirgaria hyperparasitica TaxID=470096 RepID=A0A6A6W7H8_9PEZI|nr:Clavaminate synthase-like protein [Pseudovirgaria hyperparasitica]KAF2758848.1 Clavaminate synthase-like protein [Pseudovirgaria hyperparasitica]